MHCSSIVFAQKESSIKESLQDKVPQSRNLGPFVNLPFNPFNLYPLTLFLG